MLHDIQRSKCGSDRNGFNKGKEHMSFHGLVDHARDCFTIKMPFIWKHNLVALLEDWFFKPYVFNGIQKDDIR